MTIDPTLEPSPDLPTDSVMPADDLPSDSAPSSDELNPSQDSADLGPVQPDADPANLPPLFSPADAARDNARRGAWAMNEWYDGWVLLGADGKPVMRNDGSRVGFCFVDTARLAQDLATAPEEETADGSSRRALAPLDSGFNKDWDPQHPKSTLADMTKWTRLLAYHYVQTTEPEEAVRRAVSMIFGNPATLDERGMKLWVPTKYGAEAVKSLADALLQRVSGPGATSVSKQEVAQDREQPTSAQEAPEDVKDMDRLTLLDALEHYAKGKGQPIRIPLSSLDLSGVSASQTFGGKINAEKRYPLPGEDGRTIGTITLKLVGPDTVIEKAGYDDYDFDLKFEAGEIGRDAKTALGYLVNEGYASLVNAHVRLGAGGGPVPWTRGGTPYKIYLDGEAKIKP